MKPQNNNSTVFFSSAIYSPEAVRLAAAVFEGRADVTLAAVKGGLEAGVSGAESAAGEFCNEVLNQQCRIDLGLKNSRLASLISTKALLSAAGEKRPGRE